MNRGSVRGAGEVRGMLPLSAETPLEAALHAVSSGWPVTPGTWRGSSGWAGAANVNQLSPVDTDWYRYPLRTSAEVETRWGDRPYSPLLVCGQGVDAVVLPDEVAEQTRALGAPHSPLDGPVIAVPGGDRIMLVATGGSADRAFYAAGCRWLTYRCWLPLPPTWTDRGRVRWRRLPEPTFTLPALGAVQRLILGAVENLGEK